MNTLITVTPEPLLFHMYAKVRFNRPVTDFDFICPGGYEINMGIGKNKKTYKFDFLETYWEVDKEAPYCINFTCKYPDYSSYSELKDITVKDLQHINAISDFYIHTGEIGETDLYPKSLQSCHFEVPYDNWLDIKVPYNTCMVAHLGCAIDSITSTLRR